MALRAAVSVPQQHLNVFSVFGARIVSYFSLVNAFEWCNG
jgi:hypothetical protein